MIYDRFKIKPRLIQSAFFIISLLFGLIVNGAVPFLLTPTLGQAIWTTGFSLSFLNESLFSIYATNFGFPEPAAIAFGLAGAWVSAFFIWLGLHPSDAYTFMVLFWLVISFVSAFRLARLFDVNINLSTIAALLWICMPMIWNHAGYSMVSLGIALLSFYFLTIIKLFYHSYILKLRFLNSLLYLCATLVSVFMDGYTFIMFAVGSSILFCVIYLADSSKRKFLLEFALPVHVLSFLIAYLVFVAYLGKAQFEPAPLDFFRGWGADLTFFLLPTEGIHWLADKLGISVKRPTTDWFGDSSVWKTTFALFLFIASIWAVKASIRLNKTLTIGMIIIATFAFYMSLGPSLKINSTKPEFIGATPTMPKDYAVAATGSQLISKYLPGFKNMRASYRWAALGVFSLWFILIISLASKENNVRRVSMWLVLIVFLFNLPNLPKKLSKELNQRASFHEIDEELVAQMKIDLKPEEVVAFLPWQNDFFVNYLSSKLKTKAFNIGGDKNLEEARKHWPRIMQQFEMATIDEDFADRVALLLLNGTAEVVVLTYIDLLWSAHSWPPENIYIEKIKNIENQLSKYEWLEIKQSHHYATVRIKAGYNDFKKYESVLFPFDGTYPFSIKDRTKGLKRLTQYGWHRVETNHIWSNKEATLKLPVPEQCKSKECFAVIKFSVFGAKDSRSVQINLSSQDKILAYRETLSISDSKEHEVEIPLITKDAFQVIEIEILDATSPMKLGYSDDRRILGIALTRIDLKVE